MLKILITKLYYISPHTIYNISKIFHANVTYLLTVPTVSHAKFKLASNHRKIMIKVDT